MDVRAILDSFDFIRDKPDLGRKLRAAAKAVRLEAGSYAFRTGDLCNQVAFVGAGNIRVFRTSPGGREITLYHVGPGDTCLLTFNGALSGAPYPADGLVEEPVDAAVIPSAAFGAWVDTEPDLRRLVFAVMARRVTELMALIDEVAFGRLEQRLAEFLLDAFDRKSQGPPALHTTHEHIAAELGSAREVISRLLKDLERRGIVRLERGKVSLVDAPRLKELRRPL